MDSSCQTETPYSFGNNIVDPEWNACRLCGLYLGQYNEQEFQCRKFAMHVGYDIVGMGHALANEAPLVFDSSLTYAEFINNAEGACKLASNESSNGSESGSATTSGTS
jgi:hypothetical protein